MCGIHLQHHAAQVPKLLSAGFPSWWPLSGPEQTTSAPLTGRRAILAAINCFHLGLPSSPWLPWERSADDRQACENGKLVLWTTVTVRD